jgi:lipoprotein
MTRNQGARRLTRYLSLLLALVVGCTGLAACGMGGGDSSNSSDERTAFVYSTRQNQPVLDAMRPSPGLDDDIAGAVSGHGKATIHSTGGELAPVQRVDLKVHGRTSQAIKRDEIAAAKRIRTTLAASVAASPEADVLAGISAAADEVREGQNPKIVVIDNGLPTVGSVSLPQTGLFAPGVDIAASVRAMADLHLLPDLTGVRVRWYGMGEVVAPQESLDEAAKARLTEIWETVIETAGGSFEEGTQSPTAAQEAPENLPPVTPVDVSTTSFSASAPATPAPSLSVTLPESVLPFVPDEAAFLDPEAARATALALAGQIVASGTTTVTVTGCTASAATPEGRAALSTNRARAVADLLVAGGVPEGSVTVQGLGAECPGRVPDLDAEGNLIEAAARANRVVKVTAS